MAGKAVEQKKETVKQLKEKLSSASVLVVSDYRSIPVKNLTELRKKLKPMEAEYRVFKNTLLSRAVDEAGFAQLKDHLKGPTAVLLGYKEPVAPIKALVEFIDEVEKGEIKVGLMDKALVEAKSLRQIAKLPPREVLIAKVVGGFKSPLYGLVNVLQGNIRKLVYALNAIQQKKGGE